MKTAVFELMLVLLVTSTFGPAFVFRPARAEGTTIMERNFNGSDPPFPGVGVKVNILLNESVQYVTSSDYFYVMHGWVVSNWSSYTADVQSAFLDPQQTNFYLDTNASNFQDPSLTQFTYYDNATDDMYSMFWFQFQPGDLSLGVYSFIGTWYTTGAANPPTFTPSYTQNTITLIVLAKSSTLVSCAPNLALRASTVACTANVSGSNPTGTVNWSTSSIGGSFSQWGCNLSEGTCSTTYTDNFTGFVTIAAYYSGDSSNAPSNGSFILTVFENVTVGTNVTVYPTNNLGLTFANVTVAGVVIANETPTVPAPPLNNTVGPYYNVNVMAGYSGNVTISLAFDGSNMTQQQKSNLKMMQYTPLIADVSGPTPGAPDGVVNMRDIAYIVAHFNTIPNSTNWNPACDIYGPAGVPDGIVNMRDIAFAVLCFGQTSIWVSITASVDTTNNIIYGQTTHFSFIGIH